MLSTSIIASAAHCRGHTSPSQPAGVAVSPRCTIVCVDYGVLPAEPKIWQSNHTRLTVAEHVGTDLTTPTWRYDGPLQPYNDLFERVPGVDTLNGRVLRLGSDEVWVRDANISGRDAVFYADASEDWSAWPVTLRRQSADGSWSTVATGDFERRNIYPRVSLAALGDTVALCATVQGLVPGVGTGRDAVFGLWTARSGVSTIGLIDIELGDTRYPPTSAPLAGAARGSKGAGDVGVPAGISCAGVRAANGANTELHACLVTDDGHLWHAIRRQGSIGSDGYRDMWTPFGDVEAQTGDMGFVTLVDCTALGNALHLVAVGRLGTTERIWRATRLPDGTWRGSRHDNGVVSPRDDVLQIAGGPINPGTRQIRDVATGFCNQTMGEPQLVIAFTTDEDVQYVLWQSEVRDWLPAGSGRSTYSPVYDAMTVATSFDSRTGREIRVGSHRFLSVVERPFSHDPERVRLGQ